MSFSRENLTSKSSANYYPKLTIEHIKNPNKFWAIPLLGFLAKVFILIPQWFMLIFLMLYAFILMFVNSFFVLFTGKYWPYAYAYQLGLMKFLTKIYAFFLGLSDVYPGFNFTLPKGMELEIAMPKNPNRLFAIPFFGGLARIIFLIPYFIWETIVQYAAGIGYVASFATVLFKGRYPESTYELSRDYIRLSHASWAYVIGFSDTYPSFWISMNHKNIKIALLILGAILALSNYSGSGDYETNYYEDYGIEENVGVPESTYDGSTY